MKLIYLLAIVSLAQPALAQGPKVWTEADRQYLLDNLTRTRDELVKETNGLTAAQWKFKESEKRWSISGVVEHIGIWELLLDHEISRALGYGPQPEHYKTARSDSVLLASIMEDNPHVTVEYTKPFTYTVPMELNDGKNNLAWVLKMRNESIEYLKSAPENLRAYAIRPDRPNIHQLYIFIFSHIDRHMRQIKKVKQHPKYPK